MVEPRTQPVPMPIDGIRLVFGGFEVILNVCELRSRFGALDTAAIDLQCYSGVLRILRFEYGDRTPFRARLEQSGVSLPALC